MKFRHYPVMSKEIIEVLNQTHGHLFIDCTVGQGGHSYHILKNISDSKIIAIDIDKKSLKNSRQNLKEFGDRVVFFKFNFIELFERINFTDKEVAGILVDPGISMVQLLDPERGFSHNIDAHLDMRKDNSSDLTAYEIINKYSEKKLTEIFSAYGEIKRAGSLAKKIIEKRLFGPIYSTLMLKEIIENIYSRKPVRGRVHPAAKVFQALRIFINKELEGIEEFLKKIPVYLNSGARLAYLAYHSLEDRIVKETLSFLHKSKILKIVEPFPMFPSDREIRENSASRSARLRMAEII